MAEERRAEQSMDDILASIRRIISDDSVTPSPARSVMADDLNAPAQLRGGHGAAPDPGLTFPGDASDGHAFRAVDDLSDILEPQARGGEPQFAPRSQGRVHTRLEPSLEMPAQVGERVSPAPHGAASPALAPWPFDRGEQPAATPGLRDKLIALDDARVSPTPGRTSAPVPMPADTPSQTVDTISTPAPAPASPSLTAAPQVAHPDVAPTPFGRNGAAVATQAPPAESTAPNIGGSPQRAPFPDIFGVRLTREDPRNAVPAQQPGQETLTPEATTQEQPAPSAEPTQQDALDGTDAVALIRSAMQQSAIDGHSGEIAAAPAKMRHIDGAAVAPQQLVAAPRGAASDADMGSGAANGFDLSPRLGPHLDPGPHLSSSPGLNSGPNLRAATLRPDHAALEDRAQLSSAEAVIAAAATAALTSTQAPTLAPALDAPGSEAAPGSAGVPGTLVQPTLGDVVAVALQPLLREWIDANLARIAREVLEAEVARSRGRGDRPL